MQSKKSPSRNYPEGTPTTFIPPGMDKSAAKKAAKRRRKRNSRKNKIKATSPPSGTSDDSGSDEDVILISQDSARPTGKYD